MAGSGFGKDDLTDRLAEEFATCYRCGQRPSPAAPHLTKTSRLLLHSLTIKSWDARSVMP
jgi:hypothetical protein